MQRDYCIIMGEHCVHFSVFGFQFIGLFTLSSSSCCFAIQVSFWGQQETIWFHSILRIQGFPQIWFVPPVSHILATCVCILRISWH